MKKLLHTAALAAFVALAGGRFHGGGGFRR